MKIKLSYRDPFDSVSSVMETRQNNDVIEHTSAIYTDNDIKL